MPKLTVLVGLKAVREELEAKRKHLEETLVDCKKKLRVIIEAEDHVVKAILLFDAPVSSTKAPRKPRTIAQKRIDVDMEIANARRREKSRKQMQRLKKNQRARERRAHIKKYG